MYNISFRATYSNLLPKLETVALSPYRLIKTVNSREPLFVDAQDSSSIFLGVTDEILLLSVAPINTATGTGLAYLDGAKFWQ